MIRYVGAVAILGLPLATVFAQSDQGPPRWAANLVRKQQIIMQGVPRPYAAMHDPLPDTAATLRRGRALFEHNCEACHGWSGQGNGPMLLPSSGSCRLGVAHAYSQNQGRAVHLLDHRRGRAGLSIRDASLQENAVEEGHLGSRRLPSSRDATQDALVAQNVAFESEEDREAARNFMDLI